MSSEHPFSSLAGKGAVWLLALVAFVGLREYLLVCHPDHMTGLAIRQMQPDNTAAEELRAVSQGRAWLLSGWAVLAFAVLSGAGLFWHDLARLADGSPDDGDHLADPQPQPEESVHSPEQGELR
jgi:hypothetical protein